MTERADIEEMLEELRFEELDRLVQGDALSPEWRDEIERRRAQSEDRARSLCERIIELGHERDIKAVVELSHDPATRRLLALAPETARKRAELYLREADRWEEKKRETNARRLTEARRALDGLDLELARGLMRRINGRYLSEEQEQERDQLLLDISARAMDMESLNETGRQLIDKTESRRSELDAPWWRRWFGG